MRASDARNLEAGLLLLGVGALLLFVSLFLEWFQRGLDAFEVFEVWDLVLAALAVGALAAVASRFGFGPRGPRAGSIGPAVAALVIVLFALVNPPPVAAGIDDDPSTGLWLALAASVLMTAGAVMSVARISVALAPARGRPIRSGAMRRPGAGRVHPGPGVASGADPRTGAAVRRTRGAARRAALLARAGPRPRAGRSGRARTRRRSPPAGSDAAPSRFAAAIAARRTFERVIAPQRSPWSFRLTRA